MMQGEEVSTQLSGLETLLDQIEGWRGMRPRTRSMPEPLWSEAAALARELGVYRVARALGLNFDTLKRRAKQSGARSSRQRGAAGRAFAPVSSGFVEVRGLAEVSQAVLAGQTVVEVVASDGARLSIRLQCASTDVVALIQAFRGRP
ncbi:MAG TPA: hypothetical protein VK624_02530 [Steroidobacteraceae bacterium]|nr:hypothetical protein [Steroidobacteraceae bacterium]